MIMKKFRVAALRVALVVALNSTLIVIVSSSLAGQAGTRTSRSPNCTSQPELSAPISQTVLPGNNWAVYTLTNNSSCSDTYAIEASSSILPIDFWTPVSVEVTAGQSVQVDVYFPILADGGTITDTVVVSATSQMSSSIQATIISTVIMPGGTFPPPSHLYLPFVVASMQNN